MEIRFYRCLQNLLRSIFIPERFTISIYGYNHEVILYTTKIFNLEEITCLVQFISYKRISWKDFLLLTGTIEEAIENPVGGSRAGVPPCRHTGKFQTPPTSFACHTGGNSHVSRDRVNLIIATHNHKLYTDEFLCFWKETTRRRAEHDAKLSWQRVLRYCAQESACVPLRQAGVEGMTGTDGSHERYRLTPSVAEYDSY